MKKAAILAGARPQFIKAAALYRALQPVCQPVLIHTGQHTGRQLSDDFFAELQLPRPDWTLTPQGHTPEERLGGMIAQLMPVLQKEKPDCVLVIGDTDSTLAGALCAARGGFFLVHVEAGLRCGVPAMREEQNRVVADHLAQLLFCPTREAKEQAQREGLGEKAVVTGDLTVCCVEQMVKTLQETGNDQMVLNRYGVFPQKYLLFTMHRAESEENHALSLFQAVEELCQVPVPVLFPVHPRMQPYCKELESRFDCRGIRFLPPVPYHTLLSLLLHAQCCVTDSGTLQKESWLVQTPCITLRSETEWPQTMAGGWNQLCPPPFHGLAQMVLAARPNERERTAFLGGGDVGARMVSALQEAFIV